MAEACFIQTLHIKVMRKEYPKKIKKKLALFPRNHYIQLENKTKGISREQSPPMLAGA